MIPMAEQIQTEKPALQLGRRNDAAETRVEQRLTKDPALQDLHGGTMDQIPAMPERHSASVPTATRDALSGGGQPLDAGTRASMEGAFGEDFGDVRIHTDAAADAGARAIDSTAFASGTDIGFAGGAYRPETAPGRGIIAHELAHVSETRAGIDAPNAVRRISAGEWFNRLFGGGTPTDAEMADFLTKLRSENSGAPETQISFTFFSDNIARRIVQLNRHKPQGVYVRYRLVEHLLDGAAVKEDEDAVLRILMDATQIERDQIVSKVGKDRLKKKIDDSQNSKALSALIDAKFNKAGELVGGLENSMAGDMPVNWKLSYAINAPGELLSQTGMQGVAVENFRVQQDGNSEDTPIVGSSVHQKGTGASGLELTKDPVPHGKNKAGFGKMNAWVIPSKTSLLPLYYQTTTTIVPRTNGTRGEVYDPIPAADDQEVEAELTIDLESKEVGQQEYSLMMSQSEEIMGSISKRISDKSTTGFKSAFGTEDSLELTNEQMMSMKSVFEQRHIDATNWEVQRNWERSYSAAFKEFNKINGSFEQETTDTKGGETEVGGQISLSGQYDASLAGELGLTGSATLSLAEIAKMGLLKKVLSKFGPKGAAIAAILSVIKDVGGSLSLGLDGSSAFQLKGDISGNARAMRMWQHATRRKFQFGKESGDETSMGLGGKEGGGAKVGGEASDETKVGGEAVVQKKAGQRVGKKNTTLNEISGQVENLQESVTSLSGKVSAMASETAKNSTKIFVPTVKDARLSFRTLKNEWAQNIPHAKDVIEPPKKEGE